MYKTHQRPSSQLNVKTGKQAVLNAFFKKNPQKYRKVKFPAMFRYNCNEDFMP